ncbi:MAG TPA: metal-dependent hydrolase [Nitrospiria bacterium]|nr:metal-dependent hydrolase [Nitrospiria bacterium]
MLIFLPMDPVTHTLVGVGIGNAVFKKRVGRGAVPILAIASNLPDIDALIHLSGDPTSVLMRRTLGHSLLLLPIWAFLLSLIFRRFYPEHSLGRLYGMTLCGAFAHLFFDLVNSFGVVLLWPFSDWRPELAIIFIIDLMLTGLLAAPLILALIPKLRPRLVMMSRVSIILVGLYAALCGASRFMAAYALAAEASQIGINPDFQYVFPEPFGAHRWKGVIREGNQYHLYVVHSASGRVEKKDEVQTKRGDPRVEAIRNTDLSKKIEWFFKAPVWSVHEETGEVGVYDIRFRSLLIERDIPFVYRFSLSDQ